MTFRWVCLAFALASATAAAAAEPRAPTGRWSVNFADAQCVAVRDYGTPKKPLRLLLKAPATGDAMQVAVFQEAGASPALQEEAMVRVDGRPPIKTALLSYSPKGSKERIYLLNMSSSDFALVRAAKVLTVRSEGLNATFALSAMEPLLKVVDDCVADLRRVFNVAVEGTEPVALRTRARANLAELFSDGDYPAVAIRNRQSGRVKFALLIQEDGRVADCTIVETSGVPSLDIQACALLKRRAKFEPAIGVDGKPAKDSAIGSIVWRMVK